MIVLLMVMSFIIGCVDRMCQSFLSGCVFPFFPAIVLALSLWNFGITLPVGDKFC